MIKPLLMDEMIKSMNNDASDALMGLIGKARPAGRLENMKSWGWKIHFTGYFARVAILMFSYSANQRTDVTDPDIYGEATPSDSARS